MIPPADEAPGYRLYTSQEAADMVAPGHLSKHVFLRLAKNPDIECTRIDSRVFWTAPQIVAAVAHHATKTTERARKATEPAEPAQPAGPRASRTAVAPPPGRSQPAPLKSKLGRRYRELEKTR